MLEASRPWHDRGEAATSAHARKPEQSGVSMGSGATYFVLRDASRPATGRRPPERGQVQEVLDAQPPPPPDPRGRASVSDGQAKRQEDAHAVADERRHPGHA